MNALPEPRTIIRAPIDTAPPWLYEAEIARLRFVRWGVDVGHPGYREFDAGPDLRVPASERGR